MINYKNEIKDYAAKISSIKSVLPVIRMVLYGRRLHGTQTMTELADKKVIEMVVVGQTANYRIIDMSCLEKVRTTTREIEHLRIASETIPASLFVSSVSTFDAYLGVLIRMVLENYDGIMKASEQSISISDLLEFKNIEDARYFFIDKEIESVLRDNHASHFKWFEKRLGVSLTSSLSIWPDFIELTERRNLVVHNGGVVTANYLQICRNNKVDIAPELAIGSKLLTDQAYIGRALDVLLQIGVMLGHTLWCRLFKNDINDAYQTLNGLCFDLIVHKDYRNAKALCEFAIQQNPPKCEEGIYLNLYLNLAQTLKWLGEDAACIDMVRQIDWKAKGLIYRLAAEVLLNNYVEAASLMSNAINSKEITKDEFNGFPIFQRFITSDEFMVKYRELFGEDFHSEASVAVTGP